MAPVSDDSERLCGSQSGERARWRTGVGSGKAEQRGTAPADRARTHRRRIGCDHGCCHCTARAIPSRSESGVGLTVDDIVDARSGLEGRTQTQAHASPDERSPTRNRLASLGTTGKALRSVTPRFGREPGKSGRRGTVPCESVESPEGALRDTRRLGKRSDPRVVALSLPLCGGNAHDARIHALDVQGVVRPKVRRSRTER